MALLPVLALFTIFNLIICHGYGEKIIYEDGYSVKTVVDGNKLQINPHSLVSRPKSHDFLILDSSASVFYTLSLPLSQESMVKRFAGNGAGYSDGDAISAAFNKPRSFTVDLKGNVYVADRSNLAVRKISRSGVTTTIAGGNSKVPGRADGPGRNATFSADYELTFVPDMCALLIVDHGQKLIRQIELKQEDCGSSKSGLGTTALWASAIIVPCLVGLVIGFAIRPYIMPQDGFNLRHLNKSWTHYRMKLGRQTPMYYFGTRSEIVSSALRFLRQLVMLLVSHVNLMFGFKIQRTESRSSTVSKDHVSLLDCNNSSSSGSVISQKYADQLKDLITSDGDLQSLGEGNNILKLEDAVDKNGNHPRQIDEMMQSSIKNFAEDAHKSFAFEGSFLGVSSVVKRR